MMGAGSDDDVLVTSMASEWDAAEDELVQEQTPQRTPSRSALMRRHSPWTRGRYYGGDCSNIRCRNCDELGHFGRDCPAPKVRAIHGCSNARMRRRRAGGAICVAGRATSPAAA